MSFFSLSDLSLALADLLVVWTPRIVKGSCRFCLPCFFFKAGWWPPVWKPHYNEFCFSMTFCRYFGNYHLKDISILIFFPRYICAEMLLLSGRGSLWRSSVKSQTWSVRKGFAPNWQQQPEHTAYLNSQWEDIQ